MQVSQAQNSMIQPSGREPGAALLPAMLVAGFLAGTIANIAHLAAGAGLIRALVAHAGFGMAAMLLVAGAGLALGALRARSAARHAPAVHHVTGRSALS